MENLFGLTNSNKHNVIKIDDKKLYGFATTSNRYKYKHWRYCVAVFTKLLDIFNEIKNNEGECFNAVFFEINDHYEPINIIHKCQLTNNIILNNISVITKYDVPRFYLK